MRKKLKEVCDFYSGTGFPVKYQGENDGELPFYKVGDIANNATAGNVYLSLCNNFISLDVAKEIKGTIIPSDVVVFAKIGEALKLNRRAITACDCLIDNNAMGIGGKSEYLNSMYFYFYMKNLKMETLAESTTVPSVRKTKLEEIEIDVPTLAEQSEIVDILAKLQKVINERREQLKKFDELIKARFVELFGNPIHNEKGWDTATVESVCKVIFGGGTPSKSHPEYYENGDIPWVSSKDMKTDVLTESQIYINQKGVDNSTARMVPVNSVIMVIRSGILKHTLPVAINAVPITVNQDLKVFIPGESILTRFMAVQFKMQEADILSGVRAVTADNIEFNSLKQRAMIVPPIELQKEYVNFLEQVDKSKVEVKKALDKTQMLMDSLMQEYFG